MTLEPYPLFSLWAPGRHRSFSAIVEFYSGHFVYMESCNTGGICDLPLPPPTKCDALKVQPCHSVSAVPLFCDNTLSCDQAILPLGSRADVSPFWLLRMKLWQIFLCACTFLPLGMYVGGRLGHKIIPHEEFQGRSSMLSQLSHFAFLSSRGHAPILHILTTVSTGCIFYYSNHSQEVQSVCSLCK